MKKIHDFFFTPKENDHYFLPFFRIAVGMLCLIHFLSILPDFTLLYTRDGIVHPELMELFLSPWLPSFTRISDYLYNHFGIAAATSVILFQGAYIMSCLLLVAGLFTRFSAALLMVLHMALVKGASLYTYGVDFFTAIGIFYCLVFPVGSYQSVNPAPYRRLLQLHLCMIYFFSGFDKLLGFNWHNGESIWKAVHLPYFNTDFAIDMSWMAVYPVIPILIGWGTILVEMLYPVFIWHPRTRKIWLPLVIMLHIGIALVLNLYFFAAIMIILNISGFANLANSTSKAGIRLSKLSRLKFGKIELK